MGSISGSYSRYIRDKYLSDQDSGFNSIDTMEQRNDGWTPSRSPSPALPQFNSNISDYYGVFFMDEDIKSFSADKEETKEESWNSTYDLPATEQSTSTSLYFPGVFVEGFRDGRVEFNIPGVMRDQFSPPDEINVHFKLPSDESGEMRNSDLDCLTRAGEIMTQWRKQREASCQPKGTQQPITRPYRSYFEGRDPHTDHTDENY